MVRLEPGVAKQVVRRCGRGPHWNRYLVTVHPIHFIKDGCRSIQAKQILPTQSRGVGSHDDVPEMLPSDPPRFLCRSSIPTNWLSERYLTAMQVALGLRFDYAQAKKTMGNQISSGTAISSHSISIPAFPRPIFKAGLKVYFIQLVTLLLVYGSSISPSVKNALSFGEMMCLTVWPIIARQVIVARNLGVFEDLMDYSEV